MPFKHKDWEAYCDSMKKALAIDSSPEDATVELVVPDI
jgi:hypothetical protein